MRESHGNYGGDISKCPKSSNLIAPRHFSELYQSLRIHYPEVDFFEFPPKSMFNSASEKLFRKESFHIFLNLLLALYPFPREVEHFLELRKHQIGSSSLTSRGSIESFQSVGSDSSVSTLGFDRNSTLSAGSASTLHSLAVSSINKNESDRLKKLNHSSNPSLIRLTPIALVAYSLLVLILIGSAIWVAAKGP